MKSPPASGVKRQSCGVSAVVTRHEAAGSSTGSVIVSQRSPAPFLRIDFQTRRVTATSIVSPARRVPSGAAAISSTATGFPSSPNPSFATRTPA